MPLPRLTLARNRKVMAAWVCIMAAIVTVSYLLSYQEKLRRSEVRVAQTQEALARLYDLQNNLAVAEAEARGFVITGDPEHLGSHQDASRNVRRLLPELTGRVPDGFTPAHMTRLQQLIESRLSQLHTLIQGRRDQRPATELARLTESGRQTQQTIRQVLNELELAEQRQLEAFGARAKARSRHWVTAFSLGTLLSFTLLTLVLYFLNQEIRERRQAESQLENYQEKLRSLASQLTLAEERERRRIAVHLHDNIGQKLALSNIKLGQLTEAAAACPVDSLKTGLGEVRQLLKQTIQDAKSLTFKISSPILYELGLEAAVEWLVEEFQGQHGIPAYFEDDRQPKPLTDDLRVLLFQAVNELLVNVVKHSRARHVQVSLWREGDHLKIGVSDDGLGFPATEPAARGGRRNGGFGLFSIRERLSPFGGRLDVESTPGSGTHITMTVPLAPDRLPA